MRRYFVGFFAVIGFVTVLSVVGVLALVGGLKPSVTPLPGNILLTVDLTRDLPEGASEEPILRLLAGAKPTLRDFLDAIETAGNDPRVKVLLARVGDDDHRRRVECSLKPRIGEVGNSLENGEIRQCRQQEARTRVDGGRG